MGGGTYWTIDPGIFESGLSPRGRGNRIADGSAGPRYRSIPAWAGEPKGGATVTWVGQVYPRVGGGTPNRLSGQVKVLGLSPRGRGNRQGLTLFLCRFRSIPAWAGEPKAEGLCLPQVKVYPRVGGGTPPFCLGYYALPGLSPRGRGNRDAVQQGLIPERSIPAWAGEPGGY